MMMGYKKVNPEFRCQNKIIPNSDALQMLGVTFDDMLKFDKEVGNICRKVSQQVAVLKRMRNIHVLLEEIHQASEVNIDLNVLKT